jgi:hypothetical protein
MDKLKTFQGQEYFAEVPFPPGKKAPRFETRAFVSAVWGRKRIPDTNKTLRYGAVVLIDPHSMEPKSFAWG